MNCVSLLPKIFHAIRLELLDATRIEAWDTVRELDHRMGDLIDRCMADESISKAELAREISRNMQLYKYILHVSASPDLFAGHSE